MNSSPDLGVRGLGHASINGDTPYNPPTRLGARHQDVRRTGTARRHADIHGDAVRPCHVLIDIMVAANGGSDMLPDAGLTLATVLSRSPCPRAGCKLRCRLTSTTRSDRAPASSVAIDRCGDGTLRVSPVRQPCRRLPVRGRDDRSGRDELQPERLGIAITGLITGVRRRCRVGVTTASPTADPDGVDDEGYRTPPPTSTDPSDCSRRSSYPPMIDSDIRWADVEQVLGDDHRCRGRRCRTPFDDDARIMSGHTCHSATTLDIPVPAGPRASPCSTRLPRSNDRCDRGSRARSRSTPTLARPRVPTSASRPRHRATLEPPATSRTTSSPRRHRGSPSPRCTGAHPAGARLPSDRSSKCSATTMAWWRRRAFYGRRQGHDRGPQGSAGPCRQPTAGCAWRPLDGRGCRHRRRAGPGLRWADGPDDALSSRSVRRPHRFTERCAG